MRSRLTPIIALAALIGATAAAPVEQPAWTQSKGLFCAALDRALTAAREPEPFASLRIDMVGDAGRSRMDMPGFERCHVLHVGINQVGPSAQHTCPLPGCAPRPVASAPS